MNNDIYLIGEVGSEITLETVIAAVNATDTKEPINVHIHSGGGSVYDGLAIYNYFKNLEQEVNTVSNGLVASIASIIFLAGKNRTINNTDNFLIHLPMSGAQGNAEDLEKTAKELRNIEDKLATIYANETSLSKESALEFMKKDEMLNVEWLKENNFVNEIIEFKAVATFNRKDMSEQVTEEFKTEVKGWFQTFADKFFNKEKKNKVVQDANSMEIEFTELKNSDEPKIGDAAIIDGSKAVGDYVMPNGETYKFVNGNLEEIVEKVEKTELELAQAKIDELKTQLQTSAEFVTEQEEALTLKETEVTEITGKLEEFKTEFETLKTQVTSKFDYNKKKTKEEPSNDGTRQLFKN